MTNSLKKSSAKSTLIQIVFLSIVLCVVIIISTGLGYIRLSFIDVIKIIFAKIAGQENFLKGSVF